MLMMKCLHVNQFDSTKDFEIGQKLYLSRCQLMSNIFFHKKQQQNKLKNYRIFLNPRITYVTDATYLEKNYPEF